MQLVAVFLAAVIGIVLWGIVLFFLAHNPFGTASYAEYITFFSPVFGLALPVSLKCLFDANYAAGAWFMALAPLAGLMNSFTCFLICFLIARSIGIDPDGRALPCFLSILIWLVSAVFLFRRIPIDKHEPCS